MSFSNNEEDNAKRNRGRVLDEIIEEVYETYGNLDEEEDSRTHEMVDSLGLHRRANSEVTLQRMNSFLTQSSGAESPLTLQAVQFIKEFEQSRVELVPSVIGELYTLQFLPKKKPGKPALRFAVMDPIQGELIIFKKASDYR